jgi:hypothetical protein
MPLNSTRGAASAKGFGFTAGAKTFEVDYLVVAGGGGGGVWWGGAGAGGYRASTGGPAPLNSGTKVLIKAGSTPVTVGAGGVGSPGPSILCGGPVATDGNPSEFATIISTGGGSGAQYLSRPGGSGGGDQNGLGNTPPVNPPQGNPAGTRGDFPGYGGGGGGGATGQGGAGATPGPGGTGGAGVSNNICGSSVSYAGGGGGGASTSLSGGSGGPGSPCGTGGAGSGNSTGGNGAVNTGGGAGPGGYAPGQAGGTGGSGIVIIRAPSLASLSVSPGTNTTSTTPGGCKVAKFTVSGNLTIS